MKIVVLLVNYNDEARKLYIPLLADNGITARLAPSMPEALVMLSFETKKAQIQP